MALVEQPVKITSELSPKNSRGVLKIQQWSKPERTRRAIKFWAMCWGLSVVSVIFPLVHFFLVPGFFLAGPALAFYVFSQESVVLGGEGVCPECDKPLPIARGPNRFPLSDLCTLCHRNVRITAVS